MDITIQDQTKKRRAKGEGGLTYRNGKWEAVADLGKGENGKRNRISRSDASKSKALQKLSEAVKDYYKKENEKILLEQISINGKILTINDLVATSEVKQKDLLSNVARRYVNENKRGYIKSVTLRSYIGYIKYIETLFKNVYIQDVTPGQIKKALVILANGNAKDIKPINRETIKVFLALLKKIFEYAYKELEILHENIFEKVDIRVPKTAKSPSKIQEISPELYIKILELSEDSICINTIFVVMLFTGMRVGELCGLKVEDCDRTAGKITIRRAISDQAIVSEDLTSLKQNYQESTPKTESSIREIPCPDIVFDKIDLLRKSYLKKELWKKVENTQYQNFVFLSNSGKYQSPLNIYKKIRAFTEKYNLPNIRPHQFRHTYATTLIRNGAVPSTVSKLLGHTKNSLVLDTYTDTTFADKAAAVNIAETYFREMLDY